MFILSFQQLHIYRIPINYFFLKITIVAGKAGGRCPETKGCVFHNRLACSYSIEKMSEMIKVSIVILRLFKIDIRLGGSFLVCFRIFFVVLLLKSSLHGFWVGKHGIITSKAGRLWRL